MPNDMDADADRLNTKVRNATVIDLDEVRKRVASMPAADSALTQKLDSPNFAAILAAIGFIVLILVLLRLK